MHPISKAMKAHYEETFEIHGPNARGVDWGRPEDVIIRYEQMLSVIPQGETAGTNPVSLLDVGCGYGGLYEYAQKQGVMLQYTGMDVCENMVDYARLNSPETEFILGDVFQLAAQPTYDYVVCNGILTQKLTASIQEMDVFAQALIGHMFSLCRKGLAFNVMTTKVNFMKDNLYYRNPIELFAYCFTNLTGHIKLNHAYPLYEYTLCLYKADGL